MQINKSLTEEFDTAGELNSPEAFAAYRNTPHWREMSGIILARDRERCYTCFAVHDVDVYHVTFERLFEENYDDLVTLCLKCKREMDILKRERNYSLKKAFGMLCKRYHKKAIR